MTGLEHGSSADRSPTGAWRSQPADPEETRPIGPDRAGAALEAALAWLLRQSPVVQLLLALAAFDLAVRLWLDIVPNWHAIGLTAILEVAVAPPLTLVLPAAVLLRWSVAWNTHRLLLVGASMGAAVELIGVVCGHFVWGPLYAGITASPSPADAFALLQSIQGGLGLVLIVVSLAGSALIALALARAGLIPIRPADRAVVVALLAAGAVVALAAGLAQLTGPARFEPLVMASGVAASPRPLVEALIAASGVVGYRSRPAPRLPWALLAASGGAALVAWAISLPGAAIGIQESWVPALWQTAQLLSLGAMVLLIGAFALAPDSMGRDPSTG